MPGIHAEQVPERKIFLMFRVINSAVKVVIRHAFEQRKQTCMQGKKQGDGNIYRLSVSVFQFRPQFFLVGSDGGVFSVIPNLNLQ